MKVLAVFHEQSFRLFFSYPYPCLWVTEDSRVLVEDDFFEIVEHLQIPCDPLDVSWVERSVIVEKECFEVKPQMGS